MSSLNKVILIGRCGNNPETKTFDNGGSVTNVSLATTETWTSNGGKKEKTSWHNLSFSGKLAEIVEKYVSKGSLICVEGAIDYQSYEKDGVKQYFTKIKCNQMRMLGSKGDSEQASNTNQPEPVNTMQGADNQGDIDSLPF